jgi:ribose transport system permease protein
MTTLESVQEVREVTPVQRAAELQRRYPILQVVALAALLAYGAATIDGFTERSSLYALLIQATFLGSAGAGQTIVILLGGIDFSIPAFITAGALMTSELLGTHHWSFPAVLALIVVISLAGGAFNGYVAHRFQVQSLIITLASWSVVIGFLQVWINGGAKGAAPDWLARLTSPAGETFGVPIPAAVVFWVLLSVVLGFFLHRTMAGRRIYLTGANQRAADLALVRTRLVWMGGFALSALVSALVGVLLAGFSGSGDLTIGDQYLFQGLTAVIVGGTMMGGRGDYWRTALGALVLTMLSTILGAQGLSDQDRQMLFGALILLVVAGYGRDQRLRDRI